MSRKERVQPEVGPAGPQSEHQKEQSMRVLARQILRRGGQTESMRGMPGVSANTGRPTEVAVETKQPKEDPMGTLRLRMLSAERDAGLLDLVRGYAGGASIDALAVLSDPQKLQDYEGQRWQTVRKSHEKRRRRYRRLVNQGRAEGLEQPKTPGKDVYDYRRELKIDTLREQVKARINRNVFETLQQEMGLETRQQAADAFHRARRHANEAVLNHAEILYPGQVTPQLRDQVLERQSPADMLEYALKAGIGTYDQTTPVLDYELRRQTILTAIALQQERDNTNHLADKMTQLSKLLDKKFYTGETGGTQAVKVYALFRNDTTEMIGEPMVDEAPGIAPRPGTHYKVIELHARNTILGPAVMSATNEKSEAAMISKPVRSAAQRVSEGGDDKIDPAEVEDFYRMKIVVLGGQTETDQVALEVFHVATDTANHAYFYNRDELSQVELDDEGYPAGIPLPVGDKDLQLGNKAGRGKSRKVDYAKLAIRFQGEAKPLKVTVQSLRDYLRQTFEVGTYDKELGEYDGPAWELYNVQRAFPSIVDEVGRPVDVFYPRTLYDLIPPYTPDSDHPHKDPKETPDPIIEDQVDQLRGRNVFLSTVGSKY